MTGLRIVFTLVLALTVSGVEAYQAQSPEALLGEALHLEEVAGDLERAIAAYEQILSRPSTERAIAAQALVRIGVCHEKLGNPEAREAYERVLRDYADQQEATLIAHQRLSAIKSASPKAREGAVTLTELKLNVVMGSAALSPDGSKVAYTGTRGDLFIRDLDTGQDRQVTNLPAGSRQVSEYAGSQLWSPDGQRIAYTYFQDYWNYEIRILSLDGGMEQHREVNGYPLSWSRDARYILYVEGGVEKPPSAKLLPVDGGPIVAVDIPLLSRRDLPRLSPDGKTVVYIDKTGDNLDVFIKRLSDGATVRVTDDAAIDSQPMWSPDGRYILFKTNRAAPRWDLMAVRVEDTNVTGSPFMMRADFGQEGGVLSWSDTGKLLFRRMRRISYLYTASVDPQTVQTQGNVAQLIASEGAQEHSWSPDGKHIAYLRQRALMVASADGTNERELATGLTIWRGSIAWTPDGQHVLVALTEQDDVDGIYAVSINTGEIAPVFRDPEMMGFVASAPTSGRIAFLKGLQAPQIFTIEQDGTDLTQLTFDDRASPLYPSFSPDGTEIAYALGGSSGSIVVTSLTSGETREIIGGVNANLAQPNWSPDGRHIVYSSGMHLRVVSATGDSESQRLQIDLGGFNTRVRGGVSVVMLPKWSPDGSSIAFMAATMVDQLWFMENFLLNEERISR